MKHHEIKLKNGQHIIEKHIRDEVNNMLDKGLDYTFIEGRKVSVYSDKRTEKERVTVIEVD